MRIFMSDGKSKIELNTQKTPVPLSDYILSNVDDVNHIIESGLYLIKGSLPKNMPSDYRTWQWGALLVFHHDDGQILQKAFLQDCSYHRWISSNGEAQMEWTKDADARDISNLQAQINDLKKQIGGY